MPTRVRSVEAYMARRKPTERKRPHVIRFWQDDDGRWQYLVIAGNNRPVANSDREDAPNGYATKFWALHKAKQSLPDDADAYVLEPV